MCVAHMPQISGGNFKKISQAFLWHLTEMWQQETATSFVYISTLYDLNSYSGAEAL